MKNFLVLFGFVALAFASCKKDDDTKTAAEYLTSGSWKITASTLKVDAGVEVNIFPLIDACSKDDTQTFKSGGVVVIDEGATKCSATDPQSYEQTYSLSTDGKTLTFDGETFTVLTLDGSTLKLSLSELDGGQTYLTTATFTH